MKKEKVMLEKIMYLGNMMTQLKDTDVLMENILTEARKLSHCDAGSIYKCDGDQLIFSYTQNQTQQDELPIGIKLVYSSFKMAIDENSIAGYVAVNNKVLNIDDVYDIMDKEPYSFNPSFDQKTGYHTQSMITIPMPTATGKIIGVLQLINALDEEGNVIPFDKENIPLLKHFANTAAVALERADMTRSIILRMIGMAELRDPKETGAHVNRVGAFSAEIYEAWAIKHKVLPREIQHYKDLLRIAAMLHDVGKVGIADAILKKPGKLTDEEYSTMKTHPTIGANLFGDPHSELDQMSRDIALCHHERWDGRGYPGVWNEIEKKNNELTGEEIPLWARIVALADVFDALSSRRSYKEAWGPEEVYAELQRSAGTQFDPELVDIFMSIKENLQEIRKKYPD